MTKTQYAAFVAIDWADQEHTWAIRIPGESQTESGSFANTPKAIEVWAVALAARFGGQPVAVALEQSKGPLVFTLTKYRHLVIYPVHSGTLANYRRSFRPSGAKDDPGDTRLILEILIQHRDKLRPLQTDTEATRTLQFLVEERRKLVEEKTACTNRLTAHLKMYFPQVLDWVGQLGSDIAVAFLKRWPTLAELQKARPATIRTFYNTQNCRIGAAALDQRIQAIGAAVPATQDAAVITAYRMAALAWVGVLERLLKSIDEYEHRIDELAQAHPDYTLMKSFPGVGKALAPRLIAALGSHRDRYDSAYQIQCFSGIAPVVFRSGKRHVVQYRRACPHFLRQTFHEWAQHSLARCDWARKYCEHQRQAGKGHHTAIRSLAFKWLRILFRCWKDRVPYNEVTYTQSLAKKNLPTPSRPVEIKWKSRSGMKKFNGFAS